MTLPQVGPKGLHILSRRGRSLGSKSDGTGAPASARLRVAALLIISLAAGAAAETKKQYWATSLTGSVDEAVPGPQVPISELTYRCAVSDIIAR